MRASHSLLLSDGVSGMQSDNQFRGNRSKPAFTHWLINNLHKPFNILLGTLKTFLGSAKFPDIPINSRELN